MITVSLLRLGQLRAFTIHTGLFTLTHSHIQSVQAKANPVLVQYVASTPVVSQVIDCNKQNRKQIQNYNHVQHISSITRHYRHIWVLHISNKHFECTLQTPTSSTSQDNKTMNEQMYRAAGIHMRTSVSYVTRQQTVIHYTEWYMTATPPLEVTFYHLSVQDIVIHTQIVEITVLQSFKWE